MKLEPWLLALILSGSLTACGLRGPLVMPAAPKPPAVARPAAADARAPADATAPTDGATDAAPARTTPSADPATRR